ncbi:MAG: alpha/beta hydrolase, partial [Clostridiales bacterium]|nr:alpha/beta hydrolase [Clostridiales bacterium]
MSIDDLRKGMGFPNKNLNTVEIYTRFEEHEFDGNPVKLWMYYPRKPEGKTGRPCLIYFHGGGWIGGTTFSVENFCRLIAEVADAVVVNADYSLAPEKKYPNAFNDCFSTVRHIYENASEYGIDPGKIGVGGDSAGGNLAAACSAKDRDLHSGMIRYQALIYPALLLSAEKLDMLNWKLEDYIADDSIKGYVMPMIMALSPENRKLGFGAENQYLKN